MTGSTESFLKQNKLLKCLHMMVRILDKREENKGKSTKNMTAVPRSHQCNERIH